VPREIKVDEIVSLLDATVNQRGPDFVSNECVYERDGEPYCVVGVILHRLGVPVDTLAAWDLGMVTEKRQPSFVQIRSAAESVLDAKFSDGAAKILQIAQTEQDNQMPWGGVKVHVHDYTRGLVID
jgi:hypothetical protein